MCFVKVFFKAIELNFKNQSKENLTKRKKGSDKNSLPLVY